LFILTTLAFPRGVIGLLRHARWTRLHRPAVIPAGEQA